MCIAGIIGWVGSDEKISQLSKKCELFDHRGPDGDGEDKQRRCSFIIPQQIVSYRFV